MLKTDSNIIHAPQGVGYSNHTLTKGSLARGSYAVKDGTESVMGIAFRKNEQISSITFPEGLLSIGDAAFSLCTSLKHVVIPSSVEYIGIAAFCCSGIESIEFHGLPKVIEKDAFIGCNALLKIIVPKGSKDSFSRWFDTRLILEDEEFAFVPSSPKYKELNLLEDESPDNGQKSVSDPSEHDMFGNKIVKRSNLVYNQREFSWAKGDNVLLSELFSGPVTLIGNPSYQFRRKVLFVFISSRMASQIKNQTSNYEIPANVYNFKLKYQEKYGTRHAPIFVFISDNGKTAQFFDEVIYISSKTDSIVVKSKL